MSGIQLTENLIKTLDGGDEDGANQAFIPAPGGFQGPRDGYIFQNGEKGVGYYKRGDDDDDDDEEEFAAEDELKSKRRKTSHETATTTTTTTTTPSETNKIDYDKMLAEIEHNNPDITKETTELSVKSVKKLVVQFERALNENTEKRAKFSTKPEKFLDSEVDLDNAIKNLQSLASAPSLFHVLIDTKCVPSLLSVLAHENEDICVDILELFRELFDPDASNEGEEDENRQAFQLLNCLRENDGIKMLVDCLMDRFFSKPKKKNEEQQQEEDLAIEETKRNAEETILQIVENAIEISGGTSEICEYFLNESNTRLKEYLLERVGKKQNTDGVKVQASELLSILTTGCDETVKVSMLLANDTFMDPIMMAIAPYKKKEPQDSEEREIVENLADALCALLQTKEGRETFFNLEGLELMLMCVKSKLFVRGSALKCLDFALTENELGCLKFIDAFGLKTIFSTFVGCFGGDEKKMKKIRKKYGNDYVDAECERTLSIIASLFQNINVSTNTDKYNRVVSKFVEDSFVKLDLLVESYVSYGKRVSKIEINENPQDSEEEQDIYLEKLDHGLSSLENVAIIIAHLWATLDDAIQKRIFVDLENNEIDVSHARDVLRDRAKNIGDGGGEQLQKDKVDQLLTLVYSLYMPDEVRPGDE